MEEPCDEAWLMEAECCSGNDPPAMHPDRRAQHQEAAYLEAQQPAGQHQLQCCSAVAVCGDIQLLG